MRLIRIIAAMIMFLSVAYAEENYTISGDVSFQNDGDIYICLYTNEEFKDYAKHELSPPQCKFERMHADLKKAGNVSFKFDNVQKGTYGIVTFQDINKNRMVDIENYCPKEPWGTYKESDPTDTCIHWNKIKFDLEKDITGIKIQM
jgi:uncharacterized protein (DUF2141 family)